MRLTDKAKARLLVSTCALALAVSPALTLASLTSLAGTVYAKDGSGGGGHDGGGDHSGSDHSGSGSGETGDHSGPGRDGNDDGVDHDAMDDNGRDGLEHVNATGDKLEVQGNDIEVVHANGVKEQIENGRLEVKDANGKTIFERRATAADIARLRALLP